MNSELLDKIIDAAHEPRPEGRGMIWKEFRTPPKFGCEIPRPEGRGFWRSDEVHRQLGGPGLLETVYEAALSHELHLRGLPHQRQLPIPVMYKNTPVREPLFLDILVEDKVIIEIKANEKENPYYRAQLSTHLRLTGIKYGLLINFGKESLKDGICRVVNDPLCSA